MCSSSRGSWRCRGVHYYFCEEQFNFEVRDLAFSAPQGPRGGDGTQKAIAVAIAVFDRQCHTLEQERKQLETGWGRREGGV